jgi:UDP-glucuronate decarboxylase
VILQSSTSEVYGDPEISPQPERYRGNVNTTGPRSCYDEGKRAVETLFHDYRHQYGVRTRIARIFNTYGPRMSPDDGRVISNFVVQALAGDDVTVYGDGSQTRSFCYYSDMIDGLVALMNAPDALDEPVNLGNPGEITILELARTVVSTLGSPSQLNFLALPVDDPKQRKPDVSRAAALLGWRPRVSLVEGLRRTVPYFADGAMPRAQTTLAAE